MRKYEIAAMLAGKLGYASYLEICTPTTGVTFAKVDADQFSRRVRLMYRCPQGFSDGAPIDGFTAAESSEELLSDFVRTGERFDFVFVDPFHTYRSTLCDLVFAIQLVKTDGIVMVHDCNPEDASLVSPTFHPGSWCGETYAAFLDLVLFADDLHYATVDTDYGCGIISKRLHLPFLFGPRPGIDLVSSWQTSDQSDRYSFFDHNRSELLRLTSTDKFRLSLADEPQTKVDEAKPSPDRWGPVRRLWRRAG